MQEIFKKLYIVDVSNSFIENSHNTFSEVVNSEYAWS